MPRGVRGSLTHSASAYRRGACREACCREHHRVDAARKRKSGSMAMNSGIEFIVIDGEKIQLTASQARYLQAWLKDGADNETVARRIGVGPTRVSYMLGLIQKALGFSNRAEMALAFERGIAKYSVVPSETRRRDVA